MEATNIRNAILSEKAALEGLQLRASLANEGDREALLANPDAIELPSEQIASGDVFVLELSGRIAGFAAFMVLVGWVFRAAMRSRLENLFALFLVAYFISGLVQYRAYDPFAYLVLGIFGYYNRFPARTAR